MRARLPLRGASAVLLLATSLLTVAGCGGDGSVKGSILLWMSFDGSVQPAQRMSATILDITTGGAEVFTTRQPIPPVMRTGGVATVRYYPNAKSGQVNFDIKALDGNNNVVAEGVTGVGIDPNREARIEVFLSALDLPMDASVVDQSPPDLSGPKPDLPIDMSLPPDLIGVDFALADLVTPVDMNPGDLTIPADMTLLPDMTVLPDMTLLPDMTILPDFTIPPDMVKPVLPSNVAANTLIFGAGDLPNNVATINTTTLKLQDAMKVDLPLPPNATFAVDMLKGIAVLSVGKVKVTSPITVTGSRPLAIVASGTVDIQDRIDASAHVVAGVLVAGPGGALSAMGAGPGVDGITDGLGGNDTGGGGGGGALAGGNGGDANMVVGGAGGAAYGAGLSDVRAGSGGGNGGRSVGCNAPTGRGGAGGGSIQIFSHSSIAISMAGDVDANGSGGGGGCFAANSHGAGAGGGSGGFILLEAPTINVANVGVYANGGGGGGCAATMLAGNPGDDGQLSVAAASGGAARVPNMGGGGNGGNANAPAPGGTGANGGGGGGSAGRIYLRTRAVAATVMVGSISPSPVIDTGL